MIGREKRRARAGDGAYTVTLHFICTVINERVDRPSTSTAPNNLLISEGIGH